VYSPSSQYPSWLSSIAGSRQAIDGGNCISLTLIEVLPSGVDLFQNVDHSYENRAGEMLGECETLHVHVVYVQVPSYCRELND
jgi:hypothetical protein